MVTNESAMEEIDLDDNGMPSAPTPVTLPISPPTPIVLPEQPVGDVKPPQASGTVSLGIGGRPAIPDDKASS